MIIISEKGGDPDNSHRQGMTGIRKGCVRLKILILGTEYDINKRRVEDDILLESRAGYCDNTTKSIITCILRPELGSSVDVEPEAKRLLRHEIIHAFMYESGLDENSKWGADEELVDWIAIQFPKILKVFQEVGCI